MKLNKLILQALCNCTALIKDKMMEQKSIQIVKISGIPYERGFQYGQAVKKMIHKAIKEWKLALHRNHLRDQIGRASCRERV